MSTLTEREMSIALLVAEGLSNKEIADLLYISHHTVKTNLENIYYKLNITNRVMLAVYVVKNFDKFSQITAK